MNGKLWAIVRREYLERVRTKGFVIGTVLGPALMAAMMLVPMMLVRQAGKPLRVAVLDHAGDLQPAVEQALRDARSGRLAPPRPASPGGTPRSGEGARFVVTPAGAGAAALGREAALKQAVLAGALDGYLELPADAVAAGSASYYGRNVSNRFDLDVMERAVNDVLVGRRMVAAGLDPARVRELTHGLDLRKIRVSAAGEREERGTALLMPVVMMMILYVGILMWGQQIMTSVIEEKNNRVVEVMAAGVAPTTLLAGKLLGVGAAGLTQFLVWSLSLVALSLGGAGASIGEFPIPEVTPLLLVSFVLFFVLGFTLYAALYAAVGSAVNTVQEAQNLLFPVMLPLIAAAVFFPTVLEAPDGPLALTLSLVPFFSPLIMFMRVAVQTPPLWQVALSMLLLVLAILGVLWASARVYRIGILMYGKRPTFPELMRWVRHS